MSGCWICWGVLEKTCKSDSDLSGTRSSLWDSMDVIFEVSLSAVIYPAKLADVLERI